MQEAKQNSQREKALLTLSEFRHELGIPLVLAKKLVIWGEIEAEKAIDGTIRIAATEITKAESLIRSPWQKWMLFARALGPGLITGASDDDPSGIGTYSSVGAKFGLNILWMAGWLLPMMLAIQETCARIGIVTNKGLGAVLRLNYGKKIVFSSVMLLIIANVINIGADLGAMAASLEMVSGSRVGYIYGAIFFAVLIILVEVFVKYHIYVRFLKWLTLSVVAYIITGFIIKPDWVEVLKYAVVPRIQFNSEFLFAIVAVFGTTITPYLFFWQASEEVEEGKMDKKNGKTASSSVRISKMRKDVNFGMLLANVVFFFIVITTANTFFANGINEIGSAEQAAMALRPIAGENAYLLFALGIIGTGLLAVPVLAGSGAYALSEIMKWKNGLEEEVSKARNFYIIITLSILIGLSLNFIGINPIAALYWSAFINGIIALPLLVVIMLIGGNPKIMGKETNPGWVKFFGWLSVVFMISVTVLSVILYLL